MNKASFEKTPKTQDYRTRVESAINSNTKSKAITPDIACYIMDSLSPKNKHESRLPKTCLNSPSNSLNNKINRKLK